MADLEGARRIALTLPGTSDGDGFGVLNKGKYKGFAWTWKERVDPKKPRVENTRVLAIRTANLDEKDGLIASDPEKFFTEPHYNNYPAVLIRLEKVDVSELQELLTDAWRCMAPKELIREHEGLGRG